MAKVTSLLGREILDSRGNPTVQVTIELNKTFKAKAAVPSGASTGKYEAVELRDGDDNRYQGKGVLKAVNYVNTEIWEALKDKEFDQRSLDQCLITLDGTENKARLGANAILGVSMAFARAQSELGGQELFQYLGSLVQNSNFNLPQPMFNILNGGKHADSGLDIQEFMLAPVGFPEFHEKLRVGAEVFHTLKDILHKAGYKTSVGDEGGFAPELHSNEQALDLIVEAIAQAGYSKDQVKIGLDVAASSFYESDGYHLKIDGESKTLDSAEMVQWYQKLVQTYPIMSIEDSHAEDDWNGFKMMKEMFGENIVLIGDDLLVTNIKKIQQAIDNDSVNGVLIKLNQIGTVSETIDAIEMTKNQGWKPCVSHRSGETEDTFIADLAVGLNCPLIKSGSLSRGERICKYNRLLEIEDGLNSNS